MKDERTSREKRKRRRIRNQILAYITLIVLVVLVAAGGYLGATYVMRYVKDYNDKVNKAIEEAESNAAELAEGTENGDLETGIQENETMGEDGTDNYVPEPQPETDPLDSIIETYLNDMTIEEMVAGMFMVSPEAITGVGTVVQAGEGTKKAITENPVGGLVYSAKNFRSEEQFTQMLSKTKSYSKFPIFLAVTVESGAKPGFGVEATPKTSELTDEGSVQAAYQSIAAKLAGYGVNMDFAPVAEVVPEGGNSSLQGRTFGADAAAAAPLVDVAAQTMQGAGISAVLQKFPSADAGTKSLEEFQNSELYIYNTVINSGVDCIMVSNTKASSMTGDDTPCSLSSVMINDLLRNALGFRGVVITDYLNDSSIKENYSSAEAAVAAIQAGADIILEPENYKEAYEGVLKAIEDGSISQERIRESMYRIFRVKYKNALDS